MPWLIVRVEQGLFGVNSRYVQELVSTPSASAVPSTPPFVRGVINLRGQVMPLVDLRSRLGMPTLRESTAKLVELLKRFDEPHRKLPSSSSEPGLRLPWPSTPSNPLNDSEPMHSRRSTKP